MKKLLFFITVVTLSISGMAQGNSQGKGKSKAHQNGHAKTKVSGQGNGNNDYNQTVWGGTSGAKASANQPAKVRAAFARDYPNVGNVSWSKYRGDWTATFGSGLLGTRTAIYHANGQRRDTRSVINSNQLPGGGTIWDRIFRRDGVTPTAQVVQVDRTGIIDRIFRVGSVGNTAMRYLFYNSNGDQVQYNY